MSTVARLYRWLVAQILYAWVQKVERLGYSEKSFDRLTVILGFLEKSIQTYEKSHSINPVVSAHWKKHGVSIRKFVTMVEKEFGNNMHAWKTATSWKAVVCLCDQTLGLFPTGDDLKSPGTNNPRKFFFLHNDATEALNTLLNTVKQGKLPQSTELETHLTLFLKKFEELQSSSKEILLFQAILVIRDLVALVSMKFKLVDKPLLTQFLEQKPQKVFLEKKLEKEPTATSLMLELYKKAHTLPQPPDSQELYAYGLLHPLVSWVKSLFHAGLSESEAKINGLEFLDKHTFVYFSSLVQAMLRMSELGEFLASIKEEK